MHSRESRVGSTDCKKDGRISAQGVCLCEQKTFRSPVKSIKDSPGVREVEGDKEN